MRHLRTVLFIFLAGVVAGTGLATAAEDDPPAPPRKMQGEVVAVRQQAQPDGQGEITEIRLRTQNRAEHWLRLGPAESYGNTVREGDRVRVRLLQQGSGEPAQVRSMLNLGTGERTRVCDGSGAMLQDRQRAADGTGGGSQWRQKGGGGAGSGRHRGGR